MANMSYCRFQNTIASFKECLNELEDSDTFKDMDLSGDEENAMYRLATLARLYLRRFEELQAQAEFEFVRNMDDAA